MKTSNKYRRRTKMPADYKAGRMVYIGLRAYNTKTGNTEHVKGKTIRAFDFTPDEVHTIILNALRAAAEEHQLKQSAREAINGSRNDSQS